MSPIKSVILTGLFLVSFLLVIGGCTSSTNDKSVFSEGEHPVGWLPAGHKAAAQADPAVCQECHGDDYAGGISNVSCTRCHLGGYNAVHPVEWGTSVVLNHGSYVAAHGADACANAVCHGTTLTGVDQSGPSCTSASCHISSPVEFTDCTSCHGIPPSGSTAPNRAAAHNSVSGHFAPQVTLQDGCNTCHLGGGTGTVSHGTGTVTVAFVSAYNAKSGVAVYNGDGSCSNVSCHGGQTTPVWLTGHIDVNSQCTVCHSFGTSQYNSFVSGQHDFHVNVVGFPCVTCHDTTKLVQNHFTSLNTTTMEGPASATIGVSVTSYSNGVCTTPCHDQRSWF